MKQKILNIFFKVGGIFLLNLFIYNFSFAQTSLPLTRTSWNAEPTGWTNSGCTWRNSTFACSGSDATTFDNTNDYRQVYFDIEPNLLVFKLKTSSMSGESFLTVQESSNGSAWSTIGIYGTGTGATAITDCGDIVLSLSSSSRYVKWTYTKSVGNCDMDDVYITAGSFYINAIGTNYTENFDANQATLYNMSGFRLSTQNSSPVWSSSTAIFLEQSSSGTPTNGGSYNWGTSASERAIGAMTSTSFNSPNNVLTKVYNNSGSTIQNIKISYNAERYRINTSAASISFYYSLDGSSWTALTDMDIASSSFPTGASSYTFASPLTVSGGGSISNLSIANGSSIYLRWNINTTGNNSQGIGIDDITIIAFDNPNSYFRTKSTGKWFDNSVWESSADGSVWNNATYPPTSSASNNVTILSGHVISLNQSVTTDQFTINNGGQLNINAGYTLTINNGTGTDLTISGTINNYGTITNNGSISVASTGVYNHLQDGGNVPTATWDASSMCNFTNITSTLPSGLGQNFGNFNWNNASQTSNLILSIQNNSFQVSGTLTIGSSQVSNTGLGLNNSASTYTNTINKIMVQGGVFSVIGPTGPGTVNLTITNNLEISGGEFWVSTGGTSNVTIGNDLLVNGGLLNVIKHASSPNTTLTVTRDLLISSTGRINLEFSASTNSAVINVGRNFSSTGTGQSGVAIDFGGSVSAGVTGNSINISGNFTKSGTAVFQTTSNGTSATGFNFNGNGSAQYLSYSGNNSNSTSYNISSGALVELSTSLTIGTGSSPRSAFVVSGSINFTTYSILAGNTTDPEFEVTSTGTLITSNTNGIGGTTASGSLQNFGSVGTTTSAGRATFRDGASFTFNGNTTTPFPSTMGNIGNLNINSTVTNNYSTTIVITTTFNINSGGRFNMDGTTNIQLNNGCVLTIDANGTYDNGGESQIVLGSGSATINVNGLFITRDAQGFTGTNTSIPSITPSIGNNSTVEYGRAGDQIITASNYYNLKFTGSGTKTRSGTLTTIDGTVTIDGASVIVEANEYAFGKSITNFTMTSGRFRCSASDIIPAMDGTYNITGGTIELYGGGYNQSFRGGKTYFNVEIANTSNAIDGGTIQGSGNIVINGTFTIKSGSTYKIGDNAAVTGPGNFILESDATFIYGDINGIKTSGTTASDGNIRVTGTRTFPSTAGYGFRGAASPQSVGNALPSSIKKLYMMKTNNTSIVNLSSNLVVTDSVYLINGIITTGTNRLELQSAIANQLSGGSTNSFINGNFRRAIASNTSTYDFPVGVGTASANYRKMSLINNNLGGVSYLDCSARSITEVGREQDSYLDTVSKAIQFSTPLSDYVSTSEWTLTPDAQPSSGDYGVRLYVANLGLTVADDNRFTVVKRTDTSSTFYGWDALASSTTIPNTNTAGRITDSGNGYAQKSGFTSFSKFGIAKAKVFTTPLPVEMLYFNARAINKTSQLNWATKSEKNNEKFVVERSTDGINYLSIGIVSGSGTVNIDKKYSFIDYNPESLNYYRIKQVDFDGKYAYSEIKTVSFSGLYSNVNFSFYNNQISYRNINLNADELSFVITDLSGRILMSNSLLNTSYTGFEALLDINEKLSVGMYFITINETGETLRFVVN